MLRDSERTLFKNLAIICFRGNFRLLSCNPLSSSWYLLQIEKLILAFSVTLKPNINQFVGNEEENTKDIFQQFLEFQMSFFSSLLCIMENTFISHLNNEMEFVMTLNQREMMVCWEVGCHSERLQQTVRIGQKRLH